jgi:hypothetical protein
VKTSSNVLAAVPGRLKCLVSDRGYDASHLRRDLREGSTIPVIAGTRLRMHEIKFDPRSYRDTWRRDRVCRLKDVQRLATATKLAAHFASAVALATVIALRC